MLILLDESVPRALAALLFGYTVRTVQQMAWSSISNGELLRRAAAAGFDVLVTADRNLEYQQNIARTGLGLVVLVARSNRVGDILPLAPRIVEALASLQLGQIVHISVER